MTNRCHVTDGCMLPITNGCIKPARCNHFCNRKALCIRGLHGENNRGLHCIRGLQFKDKNDQVNNTDISRTKRRICARRFPKGERKALWWGDGAKPHILKCCIHRLHCEDNRGLLCIQWLHCEDNRGLYCIHGLHCEDNPGLLCIRRLQFSATRGCFASIGCSFKRRSRNQERFAP